MNKNKRKKENANQKNMILENAFDKKVKDFVGEMIYCNMHSSWLGYQCYLEYCLWNRV